MNQGTREELLDRLAAAVGSVSVEHPTRVAIDGPPAAGKTTLADELALVLRAQGYGVIRATIDDFLFPRAQRYPRGEYSAEGCYFDTHDYDALNRVLLDPLGPGGERRFQHAVYDRTADAALSLPAATVGVQVRVQREVRGECTPTPSSVYVRRLAVWPGGEPEAVTLRDGVLLSQPVPSTNK